MIETRGLVASRGDTRVLDGLDLTIEDGEFVLLVGPNGAGKTTLVRQFNGLEDPDSGTVLVDGRPVHEDLVAARTAVGMVFQDPRDQFVAATVRADVAFGPENLGLAHDEIDRRVEGALETVGMAGRGDERIDRLSGGEQARVAIAGALAMAPDHLVLDEPLASLDLPARRAVCDHLERLHDDGTGVVLVTHDLRDVSDLADRIVVLSDGRVALDGEPDAVRDRLEAFDVRPC
ncbi:energy-coupling factor ABC transporter ATP-binding protein [Halorientalis regularis]|jgi:biotin transport system ATP-binding protein|uniref:Biotin transport system ATP-binding protein n=1 Tax=Halorientalis regularis TaxID=660518 RepID=A0A1G7JT49_9EURY|nr:ABC transporter ATP-binding protein [Halorientalis regularis]SDF28122.1 biotin transport system ATP-binding protein [Halorientalis regularis]